MGLGISIGAAWSTVATVMAFQVTFTLSDMSIGTILGLLVVWPAYLVVGAVQLLIHSGLPVPNLWLLMAAVGAGWGSLVGLGVLWWSSRS